MQFLERDGVRLGYEEVGEGNPPMLFVPGGSCDWWSFHLQLEHFGASRRAVSLDLRGHGQSDKPDGDASIAGYVDDVAWTIAELGLERPVVVGHSMGGAIALQLAADHPDLVSALVLVDPAPVRDNRVGFQRMLRSMDRRGVDEARRVLFGAFFLPGHDGVLLDEICRRASAVPDHVFRSEVRSLSEWDGAAAAAKCEVPVLHIAAAVPACPPGALQEVLPDVVTGQTVGAGHFNMLEVPEQVNSMIERFERQYVTH